MLEVMEFKSSPGFMYLGITPEALAEIPTQLRISYHGWRNMPVSYVKTMESLLLDFLPEMTPFGYKHESWLSTKRKPLAELITILNERLGARIETQGCSQFVLHVNGQPFILEFIDVPEKIKLGSSWSIPSIPLLGEKFSFPKRHTEYFPYREKFTIPVNRSGHDGVANGGSYGWYRHIYTDGSVETTYAKDCSTYSSGRLSRHNDRYDAVVTVSNGSWLVVEGVYSGQIYSHDNDYEVYGEPPSDFLALFKCTI